MLHLWSDGACGGNGKDNARGGWAFLIEKDGVELCTLCGAEVNTTNNRMEYTALIRGLEWCDTHYPQEPVVCHSDSALLINTLTQWIDGWAANNWKRKTGEIKNLDLVQKLYYYKNNKLLTFEKVAGHAGVPQNEECDKLAVAARGRL